MEIVLEILDMLIVNAHTVGTDFDWTTTLTAGETQGTFLHMHVTIIQKVSNKITK